MRGYDWDEEIQDEVVNSLSANSRASEVEAHLDMC